MKKVIIAALVLLLVPTLCWAAPCPNYKVGFQGKVTACVFGLTYGIQGATAVLTTAEGQTNSATTNAAGCYKVTVSVNNCAGAADGTAIGFFDENWSVVITLPAGYAGVTKTCRASQRVICCCPSCIQVFIAKCDYLFVYCCNNAPV